MNLLKKTELAYFCDACSFPASDDFNLVAFRIVKLKQPDCALVLLIGLDRKSAGLDVGAPSFQHRKCLLDFRWGDTKHNMEPSLLESQRLRGGRLA